MDFKGSMPYFDAMEREWAEAEEDRRAYALARLQELLMRLMPEPGVYETALPGVGMARRDEAGFSEHRFDRPLVSLLAQGAKETFIGEAAFELAAPQLLAVCVDMPSFSRILAASHENPLLTFYFYLNPSTIKDLAPELDRRANACRQGAGIFAARAGADFIEGMLQLATALSRGDHLQAKAKPLLKYLHCLLLTGENGHLISGVYAGGAKNSGELFSAIKYLRENLDRIVSARELAEAANMSESSLYRRFKNLTGISPLQYHKRLRLHKARELIMAGEEQAAVVAWKVGYESASQFSREYRKMFGLPPKRSGKP